jgi:iron complex outermembrane receptor protein
VIITAHDVLDCEFTRIKGLHAQGCIYDVFACLRGNPTARKVADKCRSPDWTKRILLILITILSTCLQFSTAQAQHASDNPVAVADDAFGMTLGLESIGMYGPGSVRGFSPQVAGNARIDGLYFDQQGPLSNRVVEGSTIRVGIGEIGYAFPAPTGIVDYDLRHAGDGTGSATIVVSAGPYDARGTSVDGSFPLDSNRLQFPMGASYQISTETPYTPVPGYTSTVVNFGAVPLWRPNDWLSVRSIIDWTQTTQAKTLPLVFTGGAYLPPKVRHGYLGQSWAEGRSLAENFGGIVTAQLTKHWSFAAGIFRSISDSPISYADLYINTQPNGSAEHVAIGYPDQRVSSTSGEARLTGHFSEGTWNHDIVVIARGRDTLALYGGSDVIELGPALINQGLQVPQPSFSYSARTNDRTELWSMGLAYRGQWQGHGELAFGLQQESYEQTVTSPGAPEARLMDSPLRGYGTAAVVLADGLTAYAGYTQGLEDSGVAPSSAQNRGAILPAARTWQVDCGIRYLLTPDVKLIAGVFEIEKPYFNVDTSEVDRELGVQRATGLEMSVSGEPIKHLHITAGALLGHVRIIGANLSAEGVGETAFNQPRIQAVINVDYTMPWRPELSMDLGLLHFGSAPATVNDALYSPSETLLSIGGRYKFTILGRPTTFRLQIQNASDFHFWNVTSTPGFAQYPPRSIFAYLTTDISK